MEMKKIFALALAFIVISFVPAYAITVSQQWDKTYGNWLTVFTSIQQTMDGGYVVSGFDFDFDFLILKLDYNGDIIWKNYYGAIDRGDVPLSIQQTFDGGYIVAGWSASDSNPYPQNILVMKLDGGGGIVWHKMYGGDDFDGHVSIKQTQDGGYIMLGYTDSFGGEQGFLAKLDGNGNITWQRAYNYFSKPEISEENYPIQQTSDGGFIFAEGSRLVRVYNIGNIIWDKEYVGARGFHHLEQTSDGGYIAAGESGSGDYLILKLDSWGGISWQKAYGRGGGIDTATSIKQTSDGGYIVAGRAPSNFLWILKLDSVGNVSWQNIYEGRLSGYFPEIAQTADGGYVVGTTFANSENDWFFWVLKLDGNGEIPGCDLLTPTSARVNDTDYYGQDIPNAVSTSSLTVTNIDIIKHNPSLPVSQICQYQDPSDIDGDGIVNNPDEMMASNISGNSFLSETDNCSIIPNGPFLGTCIVGNIGDSCIVNEACGPGGLCSMNQQDIYPPQGNGIGDACDCEGDFDCDGDCDGTDAAAFKTDFGRSSFLDPCINEDQCHGDFDCDNDCDGTDAALFKVDFGRSAFNNPCPTCIQGDWCNYPSP
jgi:hypothetical protein